MTINIYKTQKLVKQTLFEIININNIKLAQDRRAKLYFFVLRGVAEFFRCIIILLMFNEFVYTDTKS